jgi:YggT family protein
MSSVGSIIAIALDIFIIALFARVILDYIRIFSQSWRPRGLVLILAEGVYAVTDPVMRFARRFIPPLRLGPVTMDVSFIVIFFIARLLQSLALRIH